MKFEELTKKVKDALGENFVKDMFEHPDLKKLFEEHEKMKSVLPREQEKKGIKLARSARFMRALTRGDRSMLKEMREEEEQIYLDYFYGVYGDDEMKKKALTDYLNETTGSEGAHLVPLEYYRELFEIKTTYGVAREQCLTIPLTTKEMKINKYITEPVTWWIGEKVEKSVTTPAFDQITLKPEKQACMIPFSEEILADATPPLIAFLIRVTSKAFKKGEDNALWSGAGTGVVSVCGGAGVGILKDPNVIKVQMAATKTSFNDITFDDILDLVDAVAGDMDEGALFFMNRNVLNKLRKVKDLQDRYILQPAIAGEPPSLWDYPYRKSSCLPGNAQDAPNTPFMVFGNLKDTVALGDRQGLNIKLLTEATIEEVNLATFDLQALRFVERIDIEIVLPTGISVLWTHA